MSELQYTHEQMVKLTDEGKRDVILDIEQRIKNNINPSTYYNNF